MYIDKHYFDIDCDVWDINTMIKRDKITLTKPQLIEVVKHIDKGGELDDMVYLMDRSRLLILNTDGFVTHVIDANGEYENED